MGEELLILLQKVLWKEGLQVVLSERQPCRLDLEGGLGAQEERLSEGSGIWTGWREACEVTRKERRRDAIRFTGFSLETCAGQRAVRPGPSSSTPASPTHACQQSISALS